MSRVINELVEQKLLSNIIVKCVIKHQGAIFGGYLRDFFANEKSKDIDVIIHQEQYNALHADLLALGYETKSNLDKYQTLIYTCKDNIEVEVLIEDDPEMEGKRLGPCPAPDYSVNLLAYDKNGLYEWMGEFEVVDILSQIRRRVAISIEPSLERKKKFATKGYAIIA